MAAALVVSLRVVEKVYTGQVAIIATCFFSGDDVGSDIEGKPTDVLILLNVGYTLLELKNSIVAAVQAAATNLGLSVSGTNVDLPSFEHGSGA